MNCLKGATEKIGINLDGPYTFQDFQILRANANEMTCFDDKHFDVVLCNAVLEHDRFFWKSVAEIKRVTKPGGLIVIGTPGYSEFPARPFWSKMKQVLVRIFGKVRLLDPIYWMLRSTPTIEIHNAPGDYYRFSPQAFRELLFEGMIEVDVHTIMVPPIIIGAGVKAK
jgi:SAM-dependent methyltransferase